MSRKASNHRDRPSRFLDSLSSSTTTSSSSRACRIYWKLGLARGDVAISRGGTEDAWGSERRPDLIISDCRLADGKSGVDAIESLRRVFDAPIPALLISGDTGLEQLREAKAAGYLLLRKPVSPMALRTTVGRVLRTGGSLI